MAAAREQPPGDPVVTAIERVLKTERDGVEALRRSEQQARDLMAQARAQAATIGARADRCIARLHAGYFRKIQREIETLAGSDASANDVADPADTATLVDAARRVAAKLTGGP
jgi:hypothetical protein